MTRHQPPWIPPYATIPMDYLDGDTRAVVRGLRYEVVQVCRENGIVQHSVTPYTSRWGYDFVIQGGAAQYRTLMHLPHYSRLMEEIERDYPPGSLTAELTATLAQVLQLWAAAKEEGKNTLDLLPVDEIVAGRLNPFIEAWLRRDDEQDEA